MIYSTINRYNLQRNSPLNVELNIYTRNKNTSWKLPQRVMKLINRKLVQLQTVLKEPPDVKKNIKIFDDLNNHEIVVKENYILEKNKNIISIKIDNDREIENIILRTIPDNQYNEVSNYLFLY